jgi:hypothetical protein
MSLSFPSTGSWLGGSVDLVGSSMLIGISLWITEGLALHIEFQVVGIVIAMWGWDWLYASLRDLAGSKLDRREI